MTIKQANRGKNLSNVFFGFGFVAMVIGFEGLIAASIDEKSSAGEVYFWSIALLITAIFLMCFCVAHGLQRSSVVSDPLENLPDVYLSHDTIDSHRLPVKILCALPGTEFNNWCSRFLVAIDKKPCILHLDQSLTTEARKFLDDSFQFMDNFPSYQFGKHHTAPGISGEVVHWDVTLPLNEESEPKNIPVDSPVGTAENLSRGDQQSREF